MEYKLLTIEETRWINSNFKNSQQNLKTGKLQFSQQSKLVDKLIFLL